MKLLKLFLFTLILVNYCSAQNLISNSSLKSASKKTIHRPSRSRNNSFPNLWQSLTKDVRIDYFNSTNSTFHGFPIIKSQESSERIGFPFYKKGNELAAIQTKLVRPLIAGKKYEISFVIAQCNYSNFAINKIPFILTNNSITAQDIIEDENLTVNTITLDNYILYNQNWIKVKAIVNAKGGEQYFTLISSRPRFSTPKKTSSFPGYEESQILNKYFDHVAYYFIDDIELIEKPENSKDVCSYTTISQNAKDELLIKKVEELKSNKILHPTSPTSFKKMKDYTHHIVLFDISASMAENIGSAKQIFEKIYATVGSKDIVTGLVFSHVSRTLFVRSPKSDELKKDVNELNASGGTILESGLMLVNNNIVADENTKLYLITDVGSSFVSKKITQYISIKLNSTNSSVLKYQMPNASCYEYNYINNYTSKDNYTPSGIYESKNVFRIHYMSRREAKEFEKDLEFDNYTVTDISKCKFEPVNKELEYDTLLTYSKRNFVFLVDISSSMRNLGKIDSLKKSIILFTQKLSDKDVSSLIVYEAKPRLLLDKISNQDIDTLSEVLSKIIANGPTGAQSAISFTYDKFGRKDNNHQGTIVLMFTDGVFNVSPSIIKIIENNRHVHFKVYQLGDEINEGLQKLEDKNVIEYKNIAKEHIYQYIQETKKEQVQPATVYSRPKSFKKATRFFRKYNL